MKRALTTSAKKCLLATGHYARRLRQDIFPGVAVLCYHGIQSDDSPAGAVTFEKLHIRAGELADHCRLIRDFCHPISLAQWRASLDGGPPLPTRPVLVTFDDGYRTIFTLARPILEQYEIPAVAFVCSDPVEWRSLLWFDSVARLGGEAEVERAKSLSFDEWQSLCANGSPKINDDDPNAPLTVQEVESLAAMPGIEIGAHTAAHIILSRANLEQQREQIIHNKSRLESWIKRKVTAFAYPNGQRGRDYTTETVEIIKQAGFDVAFTTGYGFAISSESPFERSRFLMLAGVSASELAHRLCYSWR